MSIAAISSGRHSGRRSKPISWTTASASSVIPASSAPSNCPPTAWRGIVSWPRPTEIRRRRELATLDGIPHVYADYRELLSRDDVDIIDCAVDHSASGSARVEILKDAAKAGKAVLMQKPMATDLRDRRGNGADRRGARNPLSR